MTRVAVIVIAAAALIAGAATAWLQLQPSPPAEAAATALFSRTFADARGEEQSIAQWRGKLLVVNFWATWCAPCVEEMPDLQRVRDEYADRNVEVIGIGIDSAKNVQAFRDRLDLRFPLLVAGAGGSELGRALGNQAGVLPFTALVTPDGRVIQRKIGQIKPAELRQWLDAQRGA